MHDESLARHSHSFACLHELSPFEVRAWHVWHGTPTQPIDAASVAVAGASGRRPARDATATNASTVTAAINSTRGRARAREAASGWLGSIAPYATEPAEVAISHVLIEFTKEQPRACAHRGL